jgi:hypothetical protein
MALMPFGKYKNRPLAEVPSGYLEWLTTTELRDPLRASVVAELERRKAITSSTTSSTTPSDNAKSGPRAPRRRSPSRQASELPAPACDICGLGATAQKPLVHERCLEQKNEVPF